MRDGGRFATVSDDGWVKIWNARRAKDKIAALTRAKKKRLWSVV